MIEPYLWENLGQEEFRPRSGELELDFVFWFAPRVGSRKHPRTP
jgi:hypothetical protein